MGDDIYDDAELVGGTWKPAAELPPMPAAPVSMAVEDDDFNIFDDEDMARGGKSRKRVRFDSKVDERVFEKDPAEDFVEEPPLKKMKFTSPDEEMEDQAQCRPEDSDDETKKGKPEDEEGWEDGEGFAKKEKKGRPKASADEDSDEEATQRKWHMQRTDEHITKSEGGDKVDGVFKLRGDKSLQNKLSTTFSSLPNEQTVDQSTGVGRKEYAGRQPTNAKKPDAFSQLHKAGGGFVDTFASLSKATTGPSEPVQILRLYESGDSFSAKSDAGKLANVLGRTTKGPPTQRGSGATTAQAGRYAMEIAAPRKPVQSVIHDDDGAMRQAARPAADGAKKMVSLSNLRPEADSDGE